MIRATARAILDSAVADNERISELLTQLDGIANAPMTAEQRLQRAEPLLKLSGIDLERIVEALARVSFPWNQGRAKAYAVTVETWLEAQRTVDLPGSASLAELLDRLHKAEAAAAMLRAGYRPQRDAGGRLTWASP